MKIEPLKTAAIVLFAICGEVLARRLNFGAIERLCIIGITVSPLLLVLAWLRDLESKISRTGERQ